MESNPAKPSVPDLGYEILSPCPLAGAPLRFTHHQKLLPPHVPAGTPLVFVHHQKLSRPHPPAGTPLVFVHHQKLSRPHPPAGTPLAFPIHQNCPAALGALLCNLPCLTLFGAPRKPLTTAAAPGIAVPRRYGCPFMAPSQMWTGDGGHHSGGAAPSCRLCLIACNSRQFDEYRGRA
jgi:hypothetical protein